MNTEDSMSIILSATDREPAAGALLILGLDAADVAHFPGWNALDKTSADSIANTPSSVIWGNPVNRHQLVAVTIAVCASRQAAAAALAEMLEQNEFADLPQSNIGDVSFTNPPGTPPVVYFVRANVCASYSSFGTEPVYITEAARKLAALIDAYPQSSTPKLTMTSHRTEIPRRWRLQISREPEKGTFFQLRSGVGELSCERGVPYLTFGAGDTARSVEVHLFQIKPFSNVSTVISATTTVPPLGQR